MFSSRNSRLLVAALASLGTVACYKSVDYTKLKCSADGTGCPTGYACSPIPGTDYGTCVPGVLPLDGSRGDLPTSAGPDGRRLDGATGGNETGTSVSYDARRDGAGGAGGSDVADARPEVGGDVPIGPTTGTPCASAAECSGGYCVDGVCCDSACAGQCQSCKEVGSVGQCKAVMGTPVGGRPACGGTGVCQSQCDGIHGDACTYPDSTIVCAPASCTAGKVTTASVCDSAGACSTPAVSDCPGNQCAADGSAKCATACTASSCGAGAYCDTTGACLPTQPAGASCSAGAQCASGYCVDAVCCDGKCDGQCESCKETGSVGKCKAVTGAPLATRTACGGTGVCKGYCDGINGKACAFPDSTSICTPASCTDGKATTASVCNGSGACTTPATSQCPSNLCGADGKCSGSCTTTSCPAGTYCDSTGTCAKTLELGASCSSGTQCASGFCVDGVCCNGKCDGQCQSCKATGSVGTCKTIQGAPVSPRAACGGTGKCTAQCDGTNAAACTYPDSSTVCTPASCTAGKVTTASVCNGSGNCTASTTNACPSNLCAADGVSCAESCTSTSCSAGSYCGAGGACTPTIDDGKPCSGDIQCTHGHCVSGICCATTCGTCRSCATGVCNLLPVATPCTIGTTAGVCDNTGTCNACSPGASCTTGINIECQTGAIDCTTGQPVCRATNKAPGTACGAGPSCVGGYSTAQSTCVSGSCVTPTAVRCTSGACDGTQCLSCSGPPGASTAPTGINVSPTGTSICSGTAKTLTVSGGSLGAGASWVWYTNSAHSMAIGTLPSIAVAPSSSTTYYVRAEGPCNTTLDATRTLSVYPPPQFAAHPQSYGVPCGSSAWVTFTAAASASTTVSSIQWYSQCDYSGCTQTAIPLDGRYFAGADTFTLTAVPDFTKRVWCTITDNCGVTAWSSEAWMMVPDPSTCP